jgi:hypothetical protein
MSGRPGRVSACSTQALRSCSIASSSHTHASRSRASADCGRHGNSGADRSTVRRRQPGARRPWARSWPSSPSCGRLSGSKGHLSPGWRHPQDEDPPPARRDPRPWRPAARRSSRPRPAGRSRTSRSWTRVPLRDSRSPLFQRGAAPPGPARRALCAAWRSSYTRCARSATSSYRIGSRTITQNGGTAAQTEFRAPSAAGSWAARDRVPEQCVHLLDAPRPRPLEWVQIPD